MLKKMADGLKVGRRTVRETHYTRDKWTKIHNWALNNKYKLLEKQSDEERRIYKKRFSWLMPATYIEMYKKDKMLKLDFWVNADAYLIVSLLTFRPSEIRLDRGGLAGAVPRKMARDLVNPLLDQLKLERIQ